MSTLSTLLAQTQWTDEERRYLLSLSKPEDVEALRARAFSVTTETMGPNVYLSGERRRAAASPARNSCPAAAAPPPRE